MKRKLFLIAVMFMFLFNSLLNSQAREKLQTPDVNILKIGAIFALTGPAAPGIKDNMQGVEAAAEAINDHGGLNVKGQRYLIEIIPEDNKSTPEGVIAAANKLVYKDKVKFIVGPVLPWLSIAMTPITEESQVLRCRVDGTGTPAEMNPDLKYTFSTFIEIQYIKRGYDFFVETYPDVKKIAIVGPDEPGGQFFLKRSQEEAKAHGLDVVFAEPYPFGTEDFYPVLTKVLARKPDAIELGVGVAPWYAGLIKNAREMGFKGPMFAPSASGDIYLIKSIVGENFADDIFFLDDDLKNPNMPSSIKKIAERIKQKYGVDVSSAHCMGWEALYCLTQAIEAAESLDPTVVAKTWEKMKSIETLYGAGTMGGLKDFGINHVVMKPRPVTSLEKGKVIFLKFIKP